MKRRISIKSLAMVGVAAVEMIVSAGTLYAATATAKVGARIITPISIEKTTDLSFGDVLADVDNNGKVTVTVDGNRIATGGASLGQGGASAAAFQVTGASGNTFSIQLPKVDVLLTSGNGASMNATSFTSNPSDTGTLIAGKQTVTVGATLDVGKSQPVGDYTGSFGITVAYN